MFLVWYDEDPKKPLTEKIHDSIAAYVRRFTTMPNLVLINANAGDQADIAGVSVRREATVQPNNVWVGHTDTL